MSCDCSLLSIMLKIFILVGLLNFVSAQYKEGGNYDVYVRALVPNYGKNHQEEEYYGKATPYSFGYDLKDEHGNNQFHREESDEHGTKRGSYGYTDAYGIYRHVEYVADALGFRATIKTNEPGLSQQNPAHVKMHVEDPPASYHQNSIAYSPTHSQPQLTYAQGKYE
ncbi:cuticle protein 16.8-like [Centruroides sculpturatus]|uniref:cuticle protein 16.8-like n=1 Tax=Centruroides sculpturatus TaxID=218467 RepID=UPI000C6CC8D8|nr:cuticle protein 16.8-like [Centruroides sculpturatus]